MRNDDDERPARDDEPGSGPSRDDEPGSGPDRNDEPGGPSRGNLPAGRQAHESGRRRATKKVVYVGQGVMVTSGPSGKQYRFPGHGSVIKMSAEDAEGLAERVRKVRACCGRGVIERRLFALV